MSDPFAAPGVGDNCPPASDFLFTSGDLLRVLPGAIVRPLIGAYNPQGDVTPTISVRSATERRTLTVECVVPLTWRQRLRDRRQLASQGVHFAPERC
jgi:hypothetical protein